MSAALQGMLTREELEREVTQGNIDTVVTALPDLYGRLVGKRIHGRFFVEEVLSQGMHLCDYLLACDMEMDPTPGYAFASWESGYGDLHALPDLSTLRRVAWLERTALVLCDSQVTGTGEPICVAPRQLLQAQLTRAAARGLHPQMGSELEFFLFRDDYRAAREKGYRDLAKSQGYVEDYHILSGTFVEPVIGAIRQLVDASGIPVEFSKGEWGPGQHEINLRYAPALEMADRHVIYKLAAKEIAGAAGMAVTFMAKWHEDLAGSSFHVHMSLTDDEGEPVFPGSGPLDGAPTTASDTFRWFLGGLLAYLREFTLLLAPNTNSYKRYRPGTFAPTGIAWSWDNRTAGLRIVGAGPSLRIECRVPGADANPYLVYAALLAAGLAGLEERIDPGPAFRGDVYGAGELPQVPHTLTEAVAAFEASATARKAFGTEVVEHYLHFARSEAAGVAARVSDVERARYFERV
ncbi:MAG: glutamine synthetase family protein [Myxococcota bacterium]|nr:glutamine synthetase family protein [Myxococcota bacterium]MDP6243456.1 glutamine synthetase family protein [Myxococcota bacterium]MDP7073649.1 glutamine synthetase family protein [Myxococcota bacterium]MDP7298179.1 glutamine synthetase family protein [Myxococcota bacterium]MDP7433700.1 glutamine synthetase family protein [Myxococcota bacterium]